MKKAFLGLLAVLCTMVGTSQGQIVNMDDIVFWVGSGSKRAALVIDFHYGGSESSIQQSWVWGYRWDGDATGEDMLQAILSADVNLLIDTPGYVIDISYLVAPNFYLGETDYSPGIDVSWGYYIAGGQSTIYSMDFPWGPIGTFDAPNGGVNLPSSSEWSVSTSGSAARFLEDGSWDAWSFGSYDPITYAHIVAPSSTAYAAIPEPSSLLLFATAGGAFLLHRRRKSTDRA